MSSGHASTIQGRHYVSHETAVRTVVAYVRRYRPRGSAHAAAWDGPRFHMKILPTAKRLAKWMAYLGLVCGVLYSVIGLVYDVLTGGVNWGTAMAFMAIVGMPVLFGAFGFLCGALGALVAGGVGAVLDRMRR